MKQSIDFDTLGDIHKALEKIQAGVKLVPGVPVIARLDGRAFHTYTKEAKKPFDSDLIDTMQLTTVSLIEHFHADVGYCQSDEITLVWKNMGMFDSKVQKLCSVMASHATAVFNRAIDNTDFVPHKNMFATFDCRIWQVSDLETAADNIMWRQWDAFKNSVSMAAHSMFTTKELHGVNTGDKINMMYDKGYKFKDLPPSYRRGSLFWKVEVLKFLDHEELARIPEKYRPNEPILRSIVKEHDTGRLTAIKNRVGVLFNNEEPEYFSCDELKNCDGCTCDKK